MSGLKFYTTMKLFIKTSVILCLAILAVDLFYCLLNQKKKNNTSNNVLAYVKNNPIYKQELDSLLGDRLYQLKMQGLKHLIEDKLLYFESKKRNIPVEQLMNLEIKNKCYSKATDSKGEYIKKHHLNIKDTINKKLSYLESICRTKRKNEYLNSLKNKYEYIIKLKPNFFRSINSDKIYAYNLTSEKPDKIDVFVISDFKCHSCQQIAPQLEALSNNYKDQANFKFVPYGDYFGKAELLCELASRENKFNEMYKAIINSSTELQNDSIFFVLAREFNLNTVQNKELPSKNDYLKALLKNKVILQKYNIYTTPSFIVNNKILDGDYAIHYLEDVIQKEIQYE